MRPIDGDVIKERLKKHHDFFVDAWGGFKNLPPNDKARVDEIDNCIAEIVNAPTIEPYGTWIPCSERLPEKGQTVLCFRGGHIGDMCEVYTFYEKYWEDSYGYYQGTEEEGITAWMPLPDPYREEKM